MSWNHWQVNSQIFYKRKESVSAACVNTLCQSLCPAEKGTLHYSLFVYYKTDLPTTTKWYEMKIVLL